MNVLWVADFGLQHNIGGAQRTNDLVIKEGLKQGIKISYCHFDTPPQILNSNYDLVVSNNLEIISNRRNDIFEFILNHPKHIRYEHDSNSYLSQDNRKLLFSSAKKNIFLSDFHYNKFRELYGNIFHDVEIVTSPIDTSVFYDYKKEREDKILYIGLIHPLKGTENFIEYVLNNPNKNFVMASWGDSRVENLVKSFNNLEWLGKINFDQMPELYNKYKTLFYKPKKFEPFCRAVGEALLCGMDVEGSDNIGAIHDFNKYGIDGLKEMCNSSPQKFWRVI